MIKILIAIWLVLLGILIAGPWKLVVKKFREWKQIRTEKKATMQTQIDTYITSDKPKETTQEQKPEASIEEKVQSSKRMTEEKRDIITPNQKTKEENTSVHKTHAHTEKPDTKKIKQVKAKEITKKSKEKAKPAKEVKKTAKELKILKELKYSAIAFKERKKRDQYEKKLIEGLALDPENPEFLEMLSGYYFDTGSYVKAMTLLKKLVNKHPKHHKAIRQIGQVYIHQNDFDTAKILIEKAISIKDDDPKYFISLVDIHYTKNDLKEAIRAMEKILKLRPTNSDYLMGMATLHEENAQPTKAYHYYSKIIELDPMHDHAKQALRRLGGRG